MSSAWNTLPLQQQVNALRKVDNWRNWVYLVREYLCLAVVVGVPVWFYHQHESWGLSWWWGVPLTALAVVLVGGLQHRLSALAHEAGHYMLFRNRVLNELVSDWFCLFPLFSTTHRFRLQHLAHHQFVNDPERDPDLTQLEFSGHRFEFPMSPRRFVWQCVVKQLLWPLNLVLYSLGRAVYAGTANGSGPYRDKEPPHRAMRLAQGGFVLQLLAVLPALYLLDNQVVFAAGFLGLPATAFLVHALMPNKWFGVMAVKPDIPVRWIEAGRLAHLSGLLSGLLWLGHVTAMPWLWYYLLLWVVPAGTSFAFFMILRQVVQHGNGGSERWTNTRVFLVEWPIRWAAFPLGQDYHLPHHLFPMVPHYNLTKLHRLLLRESAQYREGCVEVDGYFVRPSDASVTVLDLMARPGGRDVLEWLGRHADQDTPARRGA
jgi:fatty acid desaturase